MERLTRCTFIFLSSRMQRRVSKTHSAVSSWGMIVVYSPYAWTHSFDSTFSPRHITWKWSGRSTGAFTSRKGSQVITALFLRSTSTRLQRLFRYKGNSTYMLTVTLDPLDSETILVHMPTLSHVAFSMSPLMTSHSEDASASPHSFICGSNYDNVARTSAPTIVSMYELTL